MDQVLCLAAGSLAGGFARWLVSGAFPQGAWRGFPLGTLLVNLGGCLAAGFFEGFARSRWPLSPNARLLLLTGFCGAFTTFSALMLETSALLDKDGAPRALAYLGVSLILGLGLFRAGAAASRLAPARAPLQGASTPS